MSFENGLDNSELLRIAVNHFLIILKKFQIIILIGIN